MHSGNWKLTEIVFYAILNLLGGLLRPPFSLKGAQRMISIQKVNIHNVWGLLALEVDETQKSFVATNTESVV